MFEERMILYVSHDFPDSYHAGHIVLKIHPDYLSRFTHFINQQRLGNVSKIAGNRYRLEVNEFQSFQGVLAWITNLEGNPGSIPEPYYPEPEPFLIGHLPDKHTAFERQMETTRIIFWTIVIGTLLIVLIGNQLF